MAKTASAINLRPTPPQKRAAAAAELRRRTAATRLTPEVQKDRVGAFVKIVKEWMDENGMETAWVSQATILSQVYLASNGRYSAVREAQMEAAAAKNELSFVMSSDRQHVVFIRLHEMPPDDCEEDILSRFHMYAGQRGY
jgi:hypothetical protein